jgi:hypothetical protein
MRSLIAKSKDDFSRIYFIFFVYIFILFFAYPVFAQTQSHPLVQIYPISSNLNMSNNSAGTSYNITGIGYLGIQVVTPFSTYGVSLDSAGSAWIRPNLYIGANQRRLYDTGSALGIDSGVQLGSYGSASAPAFSFSSESDIGLYRPAAGILSIATAGSNRANFSSGGLSLAAGSWVNGTNLNATSNVYGTALCIGTDCRTAWPSISGESGWTDAGAYVRLNNSADNVIIGANYAPQQKLDVVGDINATGTIYEAGSALSSKYGQKSVAETISGVWNFQNGLTVAGGYSSNGLTIDSSGNILTKGNLTYSGYTYVISTEEVNATANYPFGINVGGSYSGGNGQNGQIDIRPSGTTSPKARISTDGTDLVINTALYGANLRINGTVLPYSNNQFNLGSDTYRWANIYGQNIYSGGNAVLTTATNFGGNVTGTYNALNLAANSVDSAKIVDNSITSSDVEFNFVGSISAGSGISVSGGTGKGVTNTISLNYNTDLLGWDNLTNYPASCQCGTNQAVRVIGDTCTCIDITPGGAGVVGSGTVGYIPMWNGTNSINNSLINQTAGNIWITSGNLNIVSGALQIAGSTAIDSSRNVVNVGWVNASNLNATSTTRASTIYQGANQVIDTISASNPISVSGSGNSRTIGLNYDGNFTLSGSSLSLGSTGVTAGTYGSASQVPQFTVNAQGRITSASNVNIGINASSQITSGILPLARGGTGADLSGASDLPIKKSGTSLTAAAINLGSSDVTGTLPVSNGGTGQNSALTQGGIIYASSTTAMASTAALTGILQGNGASAPSAITGTANYIPKWSSSAPYLTSTSNIYDSGTNVGIGTTSPTQKLEVAGNVNASVYYDRENSGVYLDPSATSLITNLQTTGGAYLATSSGSVGIGTTSPVKKLDVVGDINTTSNIYTYNGVRFWNQNAADKRLYSPSDGLLRWTTHDAAASHAFEVSHQDSITYWHLDTTGNSYYNGTGNVGIGTTSPARKLSIKGGNISLSDTDTPKSDIYWDATNNRLVIAVA